MKNKTTKIISIFLMIILLATIICNVTLAAVDFNPGNISAVDVSGSGEITNLGGKIITIATTVGSVVSVVVLIVLGIKYMMGSAEEKAEYKKTLMPYFIGAILIFAASTIAGVIFSFATNV